MHAGGRDVLIALESRLGLAPEALSYSRAILRECGNLSSAFVYFVLEAALTDNAPGGCATCHTPTINSTQPSAETNSLGGQPMHAFSDLEIHHMRTGLADNVSQGNAGGDQLCAASLWGLGQRVPI
jgi:hypothetical protein